MDRLTPGAEVANVAEPCPLSPVRFHGNAMNCIARAALACAAALLAACGAPRPAEYRPCELRCQILVENPSRSELTIFYRTNPRTTERVFLGEVGPGGTRRFTIPEEEARMIVVVFERAGRTAAASRRVQLRPGETVPVTLPQRRPNRF
jgi:hypothetical protein